MEFNKQSKGIENIHSLFPPFDGPNEAQPSPTWDEGKKMFIVNEYESEAGNRYYKGVRFSTELAIVETWGTYHTWTYLNTIEIYIFNGNKSQLVGSRKFDKIFYDNNLVRNETEQMIREYILSQSKMGRINPTKQEIEKTVSTIMDNAFKSFLERDYNSIIQKILEIFSKESKAITYKSQFYI